MTREEIALNLTMKILKMERPAPHESCIYRGSAATGYAVCPEKVLATFNLLYAGLIIPTNGDGK